MECVNCNASDKDQRLEKCPICFKWSCTTCAIAQYGRMFCSRKCADTFFFGDDDDGGDV
jgi:hypothetical protein